MGVQHKDLDAALEDMGRWLDANRDYLPQLVLVGGLAQFLFRRCADEANQLGTPLLTTDADFAAGVVSAPADTPTIRELAEGAGFVSDPAIGQAANSSYDRFFHSRHVKLASAPLWVEFVAPLGHGDGRQRDGRDIGSVPLQSGLKAPALRYIEFLLADPLIVDAARCAELRLHRTTHVRIGHPAALVLQKPLIRKKRRKNKQMKDMAYVVDVARTTRYFWPQMKSWIDRQLTGATVKTAWLRRAAKGVLQAFEDPDAYGCIEAAQVYSDFPGDNLTAERACRYVKNMSDALGLRSLADGR